jgi:co-chaperonin GroES (HSP10)
MKLRPLQDRILVQRVKEEEKNKGWNHHPGYGQGKTS